MKDKILIAAGAALLLILAAFYLRPVPGPTPTAAEVSSSPAARAERRLPRRPAPPLISTVAPSDPSPDDSRSTNLIARLMKEGEAPKLTREQIESYLAINRRSVESLLAAFRVSGDKTFLKEAREKFPNDPRVAFASLFKTDSVEERREWLEHFKQAAPENSLAGYLSALDYFKAGQSDRAVEELGTAAGKTRFQDYSLDFMQSAEEAYRSAGYSEAEAKAIAATQLLLPHLSEFRDLGRKMVDLSNSYRQAGDQESAQAALQMATDLGKRLEQPSGWNTLIGELVGIAVEKDALTAMDPAAAYGTSGQTVQGRLDELARQRQARREIVRDNWSLVESMSEAELSMYFDREKLFGEIEALKWARSRAQGQ
jgi:hypothetical protein